MRRSAVILFVIVACGGSDQGATSTTPAATTTPTTTRTTTTTITTLPAGPIEISPEGERTLVWVPGTTYAAPHFWVPVRFTVAEEGWESVGARELWVYMRHVAPGKAFFDLDLSLVAHSPNAAIDMVAERIAASEEIDVVSPPADTTVVGYPALVLDVTAPEAGIGGGYCGNDSPGNSRYQHNETGLRLLADVDGAYFGFAFGVRSCRAARIWVVDVDGDTITIIAATERPDVFDERMPAVDRFLEGISFEY